MINPYISSFVCVRQQDVRLLLGTGEAASIELVVDGRFNIMWKEHHFWEYHRGERQPAAKNKRIDIPCSISRQVLHRRPQRKSGF